MPSVSPRYLNIRADLFDVGSDARHKPPPATASKHDVQRLPVAGLEYFHPDGALPSDHLRRWQRPNRRTVSKHHANNHGKCLADKQSRIVRQQRPTPAPPNHPRQATENTFAVRGRPCETLRPVLSSSTTPTLECQARRPSNTARRLSLGHDSAGLRAVDRRFTSGH